MHISIRSCPICKEYRCKVLRTQNFILPEGHPLAHGYDVVCCEQCGFVYADTGVSQTDYDAFYARFSKYEDKQTSTGGGESPWDMERLNQTAAYIAQALPQRHARILDIGCANGGLLKSLRDVGYANVCGLDPSPICVKNTRTHDIEAYQGTLFSIPSKLGVYDCVILSHVVEHVQDLGTAVQAIRQVTRPGGITYIEAPDATRYAECVAAPFQDFNTEHINHFSLRCLANLFVPSGWAVQSQGQKTIFSAPNMPYPALYCVFAKTERPTASNMLAKDTELQDKIKRYIQLSQKIMDDIESNLRPVLMGSPAVIVWGTGQLAMKLLVETSLGKANIAAFVDSNPINQGRLLRGVPILAPEQIRGKRLPIIITSILHQQEIADFIGRTMKLPNPIILLLPERTTTGTTPR